MNDYKVWDCKVVVKAEELPKGFDSVLRRAAIEAVENAGFEVLVCFSAWGGKLTDSELRFVER